MLKIKMEHKGKEIWLESDRHNYVVHDGYKKHIVKSGKDKGKTVEIQQHPCYFSRLDLALNCIMTKGIRKSDATTLNQMYNEIAELKRLILNRVEV